VENVPISLAAGVATKDTAQKDLFEVLKEAEDYMYKHKLAERYSVKKAVVDCMLKTLGEKS